MEEYSMIITGKLDQKSVYLRLDKPTALRFRKLGTSNTSANTIMKKILDILDKNEYLKQHILEFEESIEKKPNLIKETRKS